MKYDKIYLRKKFLLQRKKKYSKAKKFDFNLIFKLIKKHFYNKKIIIAGYYPSNYEVDILCFLKEASKKKYRIALPVVGSANLLSFKSWIFLQPWPKGGRGAAAAAIWQLSGPAWGPVPPSARHARSCSTPLFLSG